MKPHIHLLPILLFFSTALLAQPDAGYMLECNGSSSYANCGTINLSGSQITLETWIYVDAFKTGSPYISSIMGTEQTGNQAWCGLLQKTRQLLSRLLKHTEYTG